MKPEPSYVTFAHQYVAARGGLNAMAPYEKQALVGMLGVETIRKISDEKPPKDAIAAAAKNPKIVSIVTYPEGFVPNAYKWAAPGVRLIFHRNKSGKWVHAKNENYDRKRSGGRGPWWIGKSVKDGRLAGG